MKFNFLSMAFILLSTVSVNAGQFYEKNGYALGGYDPVAYFTDAKPVKGKASISETYKESVFIFASQKNKDLFVAQPKKYAPQFNGFCAFGVTKGYKAPTEADAFTVVDDKLYLNYDKSVQKTWEKNREELISKANAKWPEIK